MFRGCFCHYVHIILVSKQYSLTLTVFIPFRQPFWWNIAHVTLNSCGVLNLISLGFGFQRVSLYAFAFRLKKTMSTWFIWMNPIYFIFLLVIDIWWSLWFIGIKPVMWAHKEGKQMRELGRKCINYWGHMVHSIFLLLLKLN